MLFICVPPTKPTKNLPGVQRCFRRGMASKSKKTLLSGDSLHAAEVRTKAALDQRDEKSIARVRTKKVAPHKCTYLESGGMLVVSSQRHLVATQWGMLACLLLHADFIGLHFFFARCATVLRRNCRVAGTAIYDGCKLILQFLSSDMDVWIPVQTPSTARLQD